MKNYQIKDYQITASSAKSTWTLPSAGRLKNRYKIYSIDTIIVIYFRGGYIQGGS
jgi:hypothetical protein